MPETSPMLWALAYKLNQGETFFFSIARPITWLRGCLLTTDWADSVSIFDSVNSQSVYQIIDLTELLTDILTGPRRFPAYPSQIYPSHTCPLFTIFISCSIIAPYRSLIAHPPPSPVRLSPLPLGRSSSLIAHPPLAARKVDSIAANQFIKDGETIC
ncbi:hypothetical protein Ccrd_020750 [Cynara cardunculus var. scolymus]|uniref:Uncharacterized protein n=1 Tax=Cynara cardunculus var. scolymus TaxID=59895 RepID=A0A103Y1W2_CYNCS|nr:hypothetical protein Ccrd_020750 [Cynara cardunculus var. scolymus]